jgi:hypothetical protein
LLEWNSTTRALGFELPALLLPALLLLLRCTLRSREISSCSLRQAIRAIRSFEPSQQGGAGQLGRRAPPHSEPLMLATLLLEGKLRRSPGGCVASSCAPSIAVCPRPPACSPSPPGRAAMGACCSGLGQLPASSPHASC